MENMETWNMEHMEIMKCLSLYCHWMSEFIVGRLLGLSELCIGFSGYIKDEMKEKLSSCCYMVWVSKLGNTANKSVVVQILDSNTLLSKNSPFESSFYCEWLSIEVIFMGY